MRYILYSGDFLFAGGYRYTDDLLALDSCRAAQADTQLLSGPLAAISTPLRWVSWEKALGSYPDDSLRHYIVSGLRDGFRIGFNHGSHACQSCKSNMVSVMEQAQVVRDYLATELAEGKVLGPVSAPWSQAIHISRFGVIPKGSSGKWRLILDLSSPEGASVNDGIEITHCSLSYATVDEAAGQVALLGRGALMAKVDIKTAYRLVPIHQDDQLLLGMQLEGAIYMDTVLPFGLRSAPKIFNAIVDVLEWVCRNRLHVTLPG